MSDSSAVKGRHQPSCLITDMEPL